MLYSRLLIFFIFLSVAQAFGQKASANRRAQSAFLEASKALRTNNTKEAEKQLRIAVGYDPSFATAYQQLGDIYRKNERYAEAVVAYKQVLTSDPQLTSLTHFGLGESLLFTGNYQEAKQHLNTYKATSQVSESSMKLIDKYLSDCNFSVQHKNNKYGITLAALPPTINTENEEYFPKLTADNKTIIFTRKERNQENFYESRLEEDEWTEAKLLVGEVNSESFNEGAHCISPDGKYLFFTGCNWPNGLGSCDIYVSKKENDRWGSPHNLGAPINSRGWESQPAISADGRTLYFVSNKPGGQGGYDIYKSELKADGEWSAPTNLGPQINTSFDESSPYIHADGKTLYFASNGWPGFGQKDIYKSEIDSLGNWSHPENMGHPINNYRDQTSFHVSMNGRIGHLSAQDSTDQVNIYSFSLPENLQPTRVAYILGKVSDKNSKQPLEAKISVINTENNQVVFEDLSDYIDGKFLATLPIGNNYAVHIQREGYLFESQQYALNDPKYTDEEFESIILLKLIERGSSSRLSNIYFDVNKHDILPKSEADLSTLTAFLKLNTRVSIEIEGHTDNTGNSEANLLLSENRARAVKIDLTAKGIAANRISTKGYGSTSPVASNHTEEGRALNRRTDFKVTDR